MMNLRVRHRTEKVGGITCLKPANWQITNDDERNFKNTVVLIKQLSVNYDMLIASSINTRDARGQRCKIFFFFLGSWV